MSLRPIMPELPRRVRIHYRRPPDRVTIFEQLLIRDEGWVKITFAQNLVRSEPVRIDEEVALEAGSDAVWFTFPGLWHDIGRFHRADGRFTGTYANLITPCVFEPGGEWETTDLFLDLWIPAGAPSSSVRLLDEEELAMAESEGRLSGTLAARARGEAAKLLKAARAGTWPPAVVDEWTRGRCLDAVREPVPRPGR
ncbi:MAG: DUF402 domain-containing protein [Gemmatimonadales bacterium]|nr:MAG: DUF402 domain-containing protein [Gemmatimonadales bacterium]